MRILIVAGLLLTASGQARADCATDINTALDQARALPPSSGKPMVLEEIERARTDKHENDEDGCQEQINHVLALLKSHRQAVADAQAAKH
jgi:hypothetical protein